MSTQAKWRKKQIRDAKDFHGKETPRSGGFWAFAGDVTCGEVFESLLVESKQTDKKSYSVTCNTWDKITHEALLDGKMPMMSVEIQGRELIILNKHDFISLLEG